MGRFVTLLLIAVNLQLKYQSEFNIQSKKEFASDILLKISSGLLLRLQVSRALFCSI